VHLNFRALKAKEQNELLLNHIGAIIYTIQSDGVLSQVSENWKRVLGHATEDVVGKKFSRFVHPDDIPTCYAFLDRIVNSGASESDCEYRVIHADGCVLWHTSSITPVRLTDGQIVGYVGVAHDITRMKETEAKLRDANSRLAAVVASRDEELRQALSAVEGEAKRIGQDIHDSICQDLIGLSHLAESATSCHQHCDPSCCRVLSRIREYTARLAVDARSYSHSLTLHELEVQTLSEALETLARRTDQTYHTETEINISEDAICLTIEQINPIYRIVREALANAIKHAKAKNIWIDLVHEADNFVLSVSNNGIPLANPALRHDGLGMHLMHLRANLLSAVLELRSDCNGQTVLELIMKSSKIKHL